MNSQPTSSCIEQLPRRGWLRPRRPTLRTAALSLGAAALLGAPAARATLATYQAAVTNESSIISYYTFEQSDATDVVRGFNGTLMGGATFPAGAVGSGKGLVLTPTNRVNLGVVPDFAFEDATGSIEAWVRAGSFSGNACLYANRDGGTRYSIHMGANKSEIGIWIGDWGVGYKTVSIPNLSTNWHHLAVVFGDSDYLFKVYVDGVEVGHGNYGLGAGTGLSTQLGSASPTSMSEPWVGTMDEVAFYADALTPEKILAHYQAFFAGTPPVIAKEPTGGTYLPGVALELSVKATGPSLAYQWFKGTSALAGKTEATLSFPSLAVSDAGAYSVMVTNPAGKVPSAQVTIAVETTLPGALVRYQKAVSNETSLISYYTFDGLQPKDALGLHDGTLMGTASWGAGVGGGAAQGLKLDGSGHLGLGSVADFDFTSGSGTVEGWVRADWSSRSDYPCMFGNRDNATRWSLHLSGDKKVLTFYNGMVSAEYPLPGGSAGTAWHHVAMVFDAGTGTYYWDGVLVGTRTNGISANYVTVQLGSSKADSTSEGWAGMLDEVAFYSSALSADAILTHYNAYFLGDPPVITTQPVGGYFLVGQGAQMSVSASGAKLSYQWYKDGVLIENATNATLGAASLIPAHSGTYYVNVSNPAGQTNSATATIQVGNNIARYQSTIQSEAALLSYYTFDAGDAQDAKNAHLGTAAGTVTYGTGPGGVTNQSLTLDGTGHVELGQVSDFDFVDGNGTVEGWVQPNWVNPASYAPTLFADRDDGGSDWSVHMGAWKNLIGNWNNDRFETLSIPNSSGWHHCAIVFNAGSVMMYWDGKPIGTILQSINIFTARTTQIGSSAPTTTKEGWMGGLDEVALYSAALDDATIWNHFLAMVGPDTTVPPTITISRSGNQVTLTWPASAAGFALEYSDALAGTAWLPVSGVTGNSVTVDASAGNRFYRLKK